MTVALDKQPPPIPRAPTQAAWVAMSKRERVAVLRTLTASMTEAEEHAAAVEGSERQLESARQRIAELLAENERLRRT